MDYAEIVAVVIELIADTGRSVVFEQLAATPADAAKPWKGPAAPTVGASLTTLATFVPPSGTDFGNGFVSQELLARADQVCLVAPDAAFDMALCTSITDAGSRWRVEWVQTLKPGDTVLLHAVGVCR
jgi:hypothetical protein